MSPKQSSSLLEHFKVNPSVNNLNANLNFSTEAGSNPYNNNNNFGDAAGAAVGDGGAGDPYALKFSKTDASAMSSLYKNGSLDFGDLRSGSSGMGSKPGQMSPGFASESEKAR